MPREGIEGLRRRPAFADVSLIVTAMALMISLAVAFAAVSIGIARADTLVPFGNGGGRFALAVLIGFLIAAMGGLTAAVVQSGKCRPRRD